MSQVSYLVCTGFVEPLLRISSFSSIITLPELSPRDQTSRLCPSGGGFIVPVVMSPRRLIAGRLRQPHQSRAAPPAADPRRCQQPSATEKAGRDRPDIGTSCGRALLNGRGGMDASCATPAGWGAFFPRRLVRMQTS